MNVGGKFVKIKEECGLLERPIVISISRPQLDLKECIGTYEFGVRSTSVSISVRCNSLVKAKILHHIELLVSNEQLGMHTQAMETSTSRPIASNSENGQEMEASGITHAPNLTRKCLTGINDTLPKYKMIIIDSMSIVNVIPMTQIIKTCNDYDEVRLVPIPLSKNKWEENGQRGNQHISISWKLP